MSATGEAHVSIGDVLNQLRDEFPDITISKIRFLESQGLIDPERTPSGYRKFYGADVERLRWILRLQKDHFLPLKVIKEQLDEIDASGGFSEAGPATSASRAATHEPPETAAPDPEEPGPDAPKRSASSGRRKARSRRAGVDLPPELKSTLDDEAGEDGRSMASGGVSLTRAELARAADLTDVELAELEEYGLVTPSPAGSDRALFDEHALAAARLAAEFRQYGIEPRHLRMYRAFADREATLFEQVLLQYRRQRNPDAQGRAEAAWRDLARLGRQLRRVLLEQTR